MLSSAGTRQSLFAATFAFIDCLSPPILKQLYAETVKNAFLKEDLTQNDSDGIRWHTRALGAPRPFSRHAPWLPHPSTNTDASR